MALDDNPMDEIVDELYSLPVHWYPDHSDLERCLIQAKKDFKGPSKPTAVAIYTAMYLSKLGIQDLATERLGQFYLSAIEYSMGCSLSALFDPKLRNDYAVMPVLVEVMHHMVTTSIETDLPEVYNLCHAFFHDLVNHPAINDEMVAMIGPLHAVIELLDEHGMPSEEQGELREEVLDLLDAAVTPFTRPYGELPQAKHFNVPEIPEPPVEEVSVASGDTHSSEAPMVTLHRTPDPVTHLDGSIGIDAHPDLVRIFTPRRSVVSDASIQWRDTLDQFTGIAQELLAFWKHVHSSPLESQRQQEARAMDSVGRLMEYLFTPEQLAILAKRVPMEQVMDNMLSFVAGTANQPPHMSIPQMRISLISAAIIALSTEETLFTEAETLWKELGLDGDLHLLLTTLQTHAEGLQDRIVKVVPPKHTFSYQ